MTFHPDVCIIGGGAIGKAAALTLSRAGAQISLVTSATSANKPASSENWDQRVYALNHVARGLLSSMKVWEALDSTRIAAVDAIAVHGDGPSAGHIGFDAYAARTNSLAWIVEDQNLNQALDNAIKFANGVEFAGTVIQHGICLG